MSNERTPDLVVIEVPGPNGRTGEIKVPRERAKKAGANILRDARTYSTVTDADLLPERMKGAKKTSPAKTKKVDPDSTKKVDPSETKTDDATPTPEDLAAAAEELGLAADATADDIAAARANIDEVTVPALRRWAAELDIKGRSAMNRDDLVAAVKAAQA